MVDRLAAHCTDGQSLILLLANRKRAKRFFLCCSLFICFIGVYSGKEQAIFIEFNSILRQPPLIRFTPQTPNYLETFFILNHTFQDTASPDWKPHTMSVAKLCGGDWIRKLKIEVTLTYPYPYNFDIASYLIFNQIVFLLGQGVQ